jgi:hypothetical protein
MEKNLESPHLDELGERGGVKLRHLDKLGEGKMGKPWNGEGRSLVRIDRSLISKRSRPTCQTQNKNKSQTAGVRSSDDYNNH